jgi:hypothetical protein
VQAFVAALAAAGCGLVSSAAGQDCVPIWSGVDGLRGFVWTLQPFDDGGGPALFIGGSHLTTPGSPAPRQGARWDGQTLTMLPPATGPAGRVHNFRVLNWNGAPSLLAAGSTGVLRWTGSSWETVNTISGGVFDIALFDDGGGPTLFASGYDRVYRRNAAGMAMIIGFLSPGTCGPTSLAVFDDGSGPALYVGGFFRRASGGDTPPDLMHNGVARWTGTGGAAVGGGVTSAVPSTICNIAGVETLAVFDDGNGAALFAGGYGFDSAGGVTASNVARWDGVAWSAVGDTSETRDIVTLRVLNDGGGPALWAAGDFDSIGGVAASGVAKWDGGLWSGVTGLQLDPAQSGYPIVAGWFPEAGGQLYVGGAFSRQGTTTRGIARYGCVCPDIDGDGMVDLDDLGVVLSNFGMTAGATFEQGDVDDDQAINLNDLSALLGSFGRVCEA